MLSYLWGGAKSATDKPENENPELAMRDQLDSHGDFRTKADGTMEFKDLMVVRSVILHQALRHYQPQKVHFKKIQMEFFKKEDWQGYAQNFANGQKAYNDAIMFMTKKACEWIDFDMKLFNQTMQDVQKDKDLTNQLQKREFEVRDAFSKTTIVFPATKEVAIEAMKFRISEELLIHRKMSALVFTTSEQMRMSN